MANPRAFGIRDCAALIWAAHTPPGHLDSCLGDKNRSVPAPKAPGQEQSSAHLPGPAEEPSGSEASLLQPGQPAATVETCRNVQREPVVTGLSRRDAEVRWQGVQLARGCGAPRPSQAPQSRREIK